MIYKNALITTKDEQFLGWIEIDENHFIKSINHGQTQLEGYDCQNKMIMPAFIDSHIHGGYNLSFNDFDNFENYHDFLINLKAEGVGAFVGASVTAKLDQLKSALKPIKNLISNHNDNLPQMIGWYFEGPFISKTKKGAHQEDLIISLDENFLLDLKEVFQDLPIILTVAAEDQQNQKLIQKYQNDFIFALGHSDANYQEAKNVLLNGAKRITHIYNAMSGFSHSQKGGILNALFNKEFKNELLIELIADGVHMRPDVINFTYQLFGANQLSLVSDALPAKGLKDGKYYLANLAIDKRGNWFYLENTNTLAGSALKYNQLLKIFKDITNCSWTDLVKLSSYNSARNLNLAKCYGDLVVGQKAKFVIVDHDLNVIETII